MAKTRIALQWDDIDIGQRIILRIKTPHTCYDVKGIYRGLNRRPMGDGERWGAACLASTVIGGNDMGYSEFLTRYVIQIRTA